MNREFDFDEVGKRMPYKVPESFLEENRHRILKQTSGEEHKKRIKLKLLIPAILLAAVFAGLLFMPLSNEEKEAQTASSSLILAVGMEAPDSEIMDTFIEDLSDEELQDLAEQSENDIFLF